MTRFGWIVFLLLLGWACPAWAAPVVRWQQCDRTACRPVTPALLRLKTPVTTLVADVTIPSDQTETPLAVEIDAMASARVSWNGAVIGSNGTVGASPDTETAGAYSAGIGVPQRYIRAGRNRVTILLSAQHLWLPVDQPIHRITIDRPSDAQAYGLRHYLPTLATLSIPASVLTLLVAMLLSGRISRAFDPILAILALTLAQGGLEVSKIVIAYAYPWHLARLAVLTGLTGAVALLVALTACSQFLPERTRVVGPATAAAMVLACAFVGGFDRKAVAVLGVGLTASAIVAIPAAMRRHVSAAIMVGTAVLVAAWLVLRGPDFLDTDYYLIVAALSVGLAIVTATRPQRPAANVDDAVGEDVIILRDGARHHRIASSKIVFVKAADDYCILHLEGDREITVITTLKGLAALLPSSFQRIHRSYVINTALLQGIVPGPRGGRVADMPGGMKLPIGRKYEGELRTLIGLNAR